MRSVGWMWVLVMVGFLARLEHEFPHAHPVVLEQQAVANVVQLIDVGSVHRPIVARG